jgi:hypothetical protein
MQNFPENNLENMGGISSFKFISTASISEIPYALNNVISEPVTLEGGKTWYNGLSLIRSASFEEEQKDTDSGPLYIYKVNGTLPGLSPTVTTLLDELAHVAVVLDVTDNNGNRRLLGNTNNGCKLTYNYKSKDTPSGRPEYNYQFYFETDAPAPFYDID